MLISHLNAVSAGTPRSDGNFTVGYRFIMAKRARVVALGRCTGLSRAQNHRVGIFADGGGAALGFVTITTSAPLDPILSQPYAYLSTPLILTSGTAYRIGSEEFLSGDQWRNSAAISIKSSIATVSGACYGNNWAAPTLAGTAGTVGYVCPTFFTEDGLALTLGRGF